MAGPSWEKSPPALVERFRELAELAPEATQRPMFGYPSCTLGGHMFMSLFQQNLVLRLSEDDRKTFLDTVGGSIFAPMAGRPMKEYVVVPESVTADDAVEDWVARAYAYARTLPPKPAKAPRKAGKPAGS
jgi:TfoX/Sxy family transcriptional regulator of competence genes